MKKILIHFLFIFHFYFMLNAAIPSGYYDSANGLDDNDLKAALNNIIDGHTEFPYSSSSTDVWDILKLSDRDPNNSNVLFFFFLILIF